MVNLLGYQPIPNCTQRPSRRDYIIFDSRLLNALIVQLYLLQYSLGVKRDEMRKLEEIAQVILRTFALCFSSNKCVSCIRCDWYFLAFNLIYMIQLNIKAISLAVNLFYSKVLESNSFLTNPSGYSAYRFKNLEVIHLIPKLLTSGLNIWFLFRAQTCVHSGMLSFPQEALQDCS